MVSSFRASKRFLRTKPASEAVKVAQQGVSFWFLLWPDFFFERLRQISTSVPLLS
jgi:hypothetical protein